MRISIIEVLLLLLLPYSVFAQQTSGADPQPNFTGVYELISMKGNMYPNGFPQRRLQVTQSGATIEIIRVEGEKRWIRTVKLSGEPTEISSTPSSRETDKAQFRGNKLIIEALHLIPPDMKRVGSRENEVWELRDGGERLTIERRIEFPLPGISIEPKTATELYTRIKPVSAAN